MLEVRIFGHTHVSGGGDPVGVRSFGGAKSRRILEVLLLHRGHTVSKDKLADFVWEGRPPACYPATLDTYVCVLRKHLEPGTPSRHSVIVTTRAGYRLDMTRVRLDVDEFDELCDSAAGLPAAAAIVRLDRAVGLARGELLEHEPYAQWAEQARTEYRGRVLTALLQLGFCALELGRAERAVEAGRRALALDELCESAWRILIRAHWAAGRRSEALRAYSTCRDVLAREMRLSPAPETEDLVAGLRRGRSESGHGDLLVEAVAAAVRQATRRRSRSITVAPTAGHLARWVEDLLTELESSDGVSAAS